ncbi:hypothetical protein, partial [Microvirga aerophila]|uniref:hypothetical protein n=1 Tax=Microvirga aerophila TaxID=670291 RepID=UPI001AEDDB69
RRKYTECQLWTGTTDVLVSERISLPDPFQTFPIQHATAKLSERTKGSFALAPADKVASRLS